MTELERALVLLGRELELPPTPDIAAAIRPRLAPRRRRLWIAAVALAAAVAVAFAVPGSRGAILRFLHIRGAAVSIVDTLPQLPPTTGLGAPIDPGAADFRLLLLDGRQPEAVYARDGGYWLRYPGVLLFEFRSGSAAILKKVAATGGDVGYVSVRGEPGIWVGSSHALFLPGGAARAAGRTLVWQHGELTLRLEANVSRAEAVRLASTVG